MAKGKASAFRTKPVLAAIGLGLAIGSLSWPCSEAAAASKEMTLADMLVAAERRAPEIRAEQARRKAASAGIDAARSGYYPRIGASTELSYRSGSTTSTSAFGSGGAFDDPGGRVGYGLNAVQPLFDGWRTASAVREAQATAEAQEAQVDMTRQSLLLDAVTAYMDVVRDREIEGLRQRHLATLDDELKSTIERRAKGAASETDVAQARARRAQSIADLITARAGTAASAITFERIAGVPPPGLVRPTTPDERLPRTREAAFVQATSAHPAIAVSHSRADAQRYAADRARADGLPQVDLRAGINGERGLSGPAVDRDAASIGVRVTAPLYDGGESAARVRQAHALQAGLAEDARAVRERITAQVGIAWAHLGAARERLASEREAVTSARTATRSIAEEVRLGSRTVLDLLDVRRELVASEVRLAASKRDLVVSAYAVLAVTGALTSSRHGIAANGLAGVADTGHAAASGIAPPPGGTWQAIVQKR